MVILYGPLIYDWGRACGLQAEDAADVTQHVLQNVMKAIERFDHQSFRGWLWTITRNESRKYFQKMSQVESGAGGSVGTIQLSTLEANDQTEEVLEREWREALFRRAVELVKTDFTDITWQCFQRVALERQSVETVAKELQMTPGSVSQAKYRVLQAIKEEVERLEYALEPDENREC